MQPEFDNDMSQDVDNPPYLLITVAGTRTFTLGLQENISLFVGSGSNCQIELDGEGVNPIHCVMWLDEGGTLHIQDWNTGGKTLLNGSPVIAESVWNSGDELEIGGHRIVPVLSLEFQACLPDQPKPPQVTEKSAAEPQDPALTGNLSETDATASVNDVAIEAEAVEVPQYAYEVNACPEASDRFEVAAPFSGECPSPQEEEIEMLRMEVEQLQYEIIDRDERLRMLSQELESNEVSVKDDQTVRLVNRLEELLSELQSSDERVRGLEELLRVSDQATQAEQEERQQLESWVAEIEQRVSQREAESDAEMSRISARLQEAQLQNQRSQEQLEQVMQPLGDASQDSTNELLKQFRDQIVDLQQRLEAALEENERLQKQKLCDENSATAQAEVEQMEQKLLQLQVETSRERAETARQRAQLEHLKQELEQKLNSKSEIGEADSRILAMRQHLQDIHNQEKREREERKQRSLSGRISRLLNRVGH